MSDKHVKRTRALTREILVIALFAFVFAFFIYQGIGYLQPQKRAFLLSKVDSRSLRTKSVVLPRASILDRNGQPLAVSSETYTLGIDAKIYTNDFTNAYRLSSVTGLDPRTIISRVTSNPDSRYIRLSRRLTSAFADQVRSFKIPGVSLQSRFERFYPAAETTAQLVGITDTSENGLSGMELAYDKQLASLPGKQRVLVDASGKIIESLEQIMPPQPGVPVVLSIDIRLQNIAFQLLQEHVDKVGAESGSILMVDASNGECLVVANYPANNPNYRRKFDPTFNRNRVFTDLFEPGSTIKPLSIAAALHHGKWHPNTPVPIGNGVLNVDGFNIRDLGRHGKIISVQQVLVKSSNVGAAIMGLKTGANALIKTYIDYGFINTTGSNFPGEASGRLPLAGRISKSRNATMSYGYGFDLTLAELTRAYIALARDGQLLPLRLTLNPGAAKITSEQIIDNQVAAQVREMMTGVTQDGGTAPNAAIPGHQVAGKTGTVHIVKDGRYSDDSYNALFIGMAPAAAVRLVVAVIVREPRGDNYYGSESAAPIFRELMSHSLRVLRITPEV